MKLSNAFLIAGLLMAAALPVAAQSTVVATGKIESMLAGEKDVGNSLHVVLTDTGGQKFELPQGYNLFTASGRGMLELLSSARRTGSRVSLICIGACAALTFNSVLVD